jgi:hypothetical protein
MTCVPVPGTQTPLYTANRSHAQVLIVLMHLHVVLPRTYMFLRRPRRSPRPCCLPMQPLQRPPQPRSWPKRLQDDPLVIQAHTQADGQAGWLTDGRTDGRMDRQTGRQAGRRTRWRADRQTGEWLGKLTDGCLASQLGVNFCVSYCFPRPDASQANHGAQVVTETGRTACVETAHRLGCGGVSALGRSEAGSEGDWRQC